MLRAIPLAIGLVLAGTGLLSACSSSDSAADPDAAFTAASPDPTFAARILAPVIVDASATTAAAKVGETVVFDVADPVTTSVAVDKPEVIDVKPGYTDGSATFNPGGVAKQVGTAVVTLTASDGSARSVTVTVMAA